MIRWCLYCQTYIGESVPYDNYGFSYGTCGKCAAAERDGSVHKSGLEEHAIFKCKVLEAAQAGRMLDLDRLLEDGIRIGLRPIDLLFGVLQPSLYEVGELWASAKLSVSNEHVFTSFVNALIEMLFSKYCTHTKYRQATEPEVLLVPAEGNSHIVGLRMIEFMLMTESIPSFVVFPSIPARDVKDMVSRFRPKILGISLALLPQMSSVREIVREVRSLDGVECPRIILGGYPVRSKIFGEKMARDMDITLGSSLHDVLRLVEEVRKETQ